ncbi:helix-turn-helix domain-containing protein [Thalassovita sp.]|uniref:helix-turn-helix domain-containing protein n=1 Tax=Thalassovita sp. TaxID=1979401 RepID=UPI0029DE7DA7|nr:helix-turn-helix domain-containing protein [Thalassovita sp.]
MPKQARLNRIKAFRCYTFAEAAQACGVSERTVRNWASDGLPVLNEDRPALVRGDALLIFLKGQRKARRNRLSLDRFYCLRCRQPRPAAGGLAECQSTDGRLSLIALCDECETILHKPVAMADLPELRRLFDLDEGA